MNASTAAQRRVGYPDRNADLGSGRHDYQNSTLSELRGRAFVTIHNELRGWAQVATVTMVVLNSRAPYDKPKSHAVSRGVEGDGPRGTRSPESRGRAE